MILASSSLSPFSQNFMHDMFPKMIFLKDAKSLVAQLAFLGVFNGDILGSNLPHPQLLKYQKIKKDCS